MKYVLGEQFTDLERMAAGFAGPNGSVLLEGRNQAALKVLDQQLDAGHKKVCIFYGAAHMPDLEDHLLQEFGFHRVRQHWLGAWSIRRE